MNESMNTSSEFSDSNRFNTMDEDVLNYLSTLSSQQQKQLDDFVRKEILFIFILLRGLSKHVFCCYLKVDLT